jgi:hypothetical protein
MMVLDPTRLIAKIGLNVPLIGLYDAPDPKPFEPLIRPPYGQRSCIFAYYKNWIKGETLLLTKEQFGCGGAGYWLCDVTNRSREDFISFLVDEEGLKASYELMNQWLDKQKPFFQSHPNILIGPLQDDQYTFLKSVSFFVNPDLMGVLMLGAQYNHSPTDPPPVIAPFGSGCSQLVSSFDDLTVPQAVIGATDIAMRQHLPADSLTFTVTKPMYEQLCKLDERSFLHKPFWERLRSARGL